MKKDKIFGKEGISLGNYTKYEPIQYMNPQNLVVFTLQVPTLQRLLYFMGSYTLKAPISYGSYNLRLSSFMAPIKYRIHFINYRTLYFIKSL